MKFYVRQPRREKMYNVKRYNEETARYELLAVFDDRNQANRFAHEHHTSTLEFVMVDWEGGYEIQ